MMDADNIWMWWEKARYTINQNSQALLVALHCEIWILEKRLHILLSNTFVRWNIDGISLAFSQPLPVSSLSCKLSRPPLWCLVHLSTDEILPRSCPATASSKFRSCIFVTILATILSFTNEAIVPFTDWKSTPHSHIISIVVLQWLKKWLPNVWYKQGLAIIIKVTT